MKDPMFYIALFAIVILMGQCGYTSMINNKLEEIVEKTDSILTAIEKENGD